MKPEIDKSDMLIKTLCEFESQLETKKADSQPIKANITLSYTKLEKRLIDMFTENTGCDILDSGGAYGRAWQKNREIKDFNKIPNVKVTTYDNEIDLISINTYKFLKHHLAITPESEKLNRQFQKYMNSNEDGYLSNMEDFCEEVLNIKYQTINTYNYENLLDMILQFTTFEYEEESYIILQIHGGCDVRGGYTKPQIFAFNDDSDYFHIHMFDIVCRCKKCNMDWYTDDSGSNWYYNGTYSNNKTLDNEPDTELKYIVKDGKVCHKNCKGEIEFNVYWGE